MKTFIDTYKKASLEFEQVKGIKNPEELKRKLRELIEEEPCFFKPYVLLYEVLENEGKLVDAKEVLEDAYAKVKRYITLPSGELPDSVPWDYESNRHILELLVNYGIFLWETGQIDRALEVLKFTYRLDRRDEAGVRYYILAIKLGLGLDKFERAFSVEGSYDTKDLENWFNSHKEVFYREISDL